MVFGKTPKNTVYAQKQDRTVEKAEKKIRKAYGDISVLDAGTPFQEALSRMEDTAIEIKKKSGIPFVSGTRLGIFGELFNKKNK